MGSGRAEVNLVTGAFGYTGKYITRRLLSMGETVKTLTGHPGRESPFGNQVQVFPFNFDSPRELMRSLQGVPTMYNTYWIRFSYGNITFDKAVENTKALLEAAEEAGVQRFVHVSVTNASKASSLPYFREKGRVEELVMRSNLSYAILRPALIFGNEDILLNNIAWFLRKFPLFPVGGSGSYRVQPIYVEDLADLAVNAGREDANMLIDAVGPETYAFTALVRLIADKIRSRARVIHVPPRLFLFLARLMGYIVRDVTLTRDEMDGLTASLLVSEGPPTGHTNLSHWLEQNSQVVGAKYASEVRRHYGGVR